MRATGTVKKVPAKPRALKNRIETSADQSACSNADFNRKVQEIAYQLYVARGCAHGFDVEDWIKAEQMVKGS